MASIKIAPQETKLEVRLSHYDKIALRHVNLDKVTYCDADQYHFVIVKKIIESLQYFAEVNLDIGPSDS